MDTTITEMGTTYQIKMDGNNYYVVRYGDEILKVLNKNFNAVNDDEIIRKVSLNFGSIDLVVLLVDGKPKGMYPKSRFVDYDGAIWWDSIKVVTVPLKGYMSEEINIGNISKYM